MVGLGMVGLGMVGFGMVVGVVGGVVGMVGVVVGVVGGGAEVGRSAAEVAKGGVVLAQELERVAVSNLLQLGRADRVGDALLRVDCIQGEEGVGGGQWVRGEG